MSDAYLTPKIYLSESHKDLDSKFIDFIHNLSSDMFDYIRSKAFDNTNLYTKTSWQLELIVDTNILFSEVRSLAINGKSFFNTITNNPFIKIYAPSQLREELHEKIRIKFPKEKKTRDLDIADCIKKADMLLSKISIRDDIGQESWDKAKSYMEKRDKDDISFVALNISLKKHGILTNDKDISDQPEIKTWKLKDAGEVLTEITKGAFSFVISHASIPAIWKLLGRIIGLIWQIFIELSKRVIHATASLITSGISSLTNPYIVFLVGAGILTYNYYKEDLKLTLDIIKSSITDIIIFFRDVWEMFNEIYATLKPLIKVSSEMLLYFIIQSDNALKALTKLEDERPS